MISKENKYLFLIITIFIGACIETDIFLPAMVDMMNVFAVSEDAIQGLLTWNFVGICLSCPLYGPIADSFGRRKPLLVALGLFFIGSLMTLYTTDFSTMLIGRALQGLGSGGCFTIGTAIIFDFFPQERAMIALNKINSIVPFIMALAPMLGGYLNGAFGFRSNFIAIAILVFISLSAALFFFKETLPKERRIPFNGKTIVHDFKLVMSSIPFWQTTLSFCLIFSAYIAFLSTISVLYVTELGVHKQSIPYFQAALLGSWLIANLLFKRLIQYQGIRNIKMAGISLLALGGIGFFITAVFLPKNPYLQTVMMSIYAFGANWINGIYFPEGMSFFPDKKGTAASIMTCARLLLSALVVFTVSVLYDGTVYPIMFAITTITVIVTGMLLSYERIFTGLKLTKSPQTKT